MDTSFEQSYMEQTPIAYRRKTGQYFTPPHIAEVMVEWIASSRPIKLLDPAVGLGIFPRSLKQRIPQATFDWTLYDIDEKFIHPLQSLGLSLYNEDFLQSNWEERFDGIIANPPYFKLRNYDHKVDMLRIFEEKLGFRLPGNTNIYNLFILKCLEQLNSKGRAAFIVPSDFLNADYGKRIKEYLVEHKLLDYVVITDYQVSWFEDAMTTSALLLCSRETNKKKLEFIYIQSEQQMEEFKGLLQDKHAVTHHGKSYNYEELDPSVKWLQYYHDSVLESYPNLKPFHKFGKATRGIATGANEFFCLTEEQRLYWGLNKEIAFPCLTKAYQASDSFFTRDDWTSLKDDNHPVYVLQIKQAGIENTEVRNYIHYGKEQGFDQRYLTKHRDPWYKPELRDPAPILFRVFNRTRLKFIRNEAEVLHLTSFHGLYIHQEYQQETDIIMAYFLTDIAEKIMHESRREYGKGLVKYEPNDLNHACVVDFNQITDKEKYQIRELYQRVRRFDPSDRKDSLQQLNSLFENILLR